MRSTVYRKNIKLLMQAPDEAYDALLQKGLAPLCFADIQRALMPLAGVCPGCRKSWPKYTDFIYTSGLAYPDDCRCVECAEKQAVEMGNRVYKDFNAGLETVYRDLAPDTMQTTYSVLTSYVLTTHIEQEAEELEHKCQGVPVFGVQALCMNDAKPLKRIACNVKQELLTGVGDALTYYSKLGFMCGRCVAMTCGKVMPKGDRVYNTATVACAPSDRLSTFRVYQYARRCIAERFLWVIENAGGTVHTSIKRASRPNACYGWVEWMSGATEHTSSMHGFDSLEDF